MTVVRVFNFDKPVQNVIAENTRFKACTGFIVRHRGVRFVVTVAHGEIKAVESVMAVRCQGQEIGTKIGKARYVDVKHDIAVFAISDRYYTAPTRLAERHDFTMGQTLASEGYSEELAPALNLRDGGMFDGFVTMQCKVTGSAEMDYNESNITDKKGIGCCCFHEVNSKHDFFIYHSDATLSYYDGLCGAPVFNDRREIVGMHCLGFGAYHGAVKLPHIQNAVVEARKRVK